MKMAAAIPAIRHYIKALAKLFTLGKDERLKSRKQIEQLFKEGKRFAVSPFRVFYVLSEEKPSVIGSPLLFGVAAGTRSFKKAADRNRIKRLVREAWRLHKNDLKDLLKQQNRQLNVFFVYVAKEILSYGEIQESIKISIDRLDKIVTNKT
jgi:ribonuclease P protein component